MRRRKLLRTGLTTLLILLAANQAVELLRIKYWRPDERSWRINLYAYQRHRLQPEILVLGSSRTQYGVSIRRVEEALVAASRSAAVYNLGQPFGNTFKNAIILRDVARSNGCPGIALLEVSPELLNGALDQTSFTSDYASFGDLPLLAPDLASPGQLDAFLTGSFSGLTGLYYNAVHPPPAESVAGALERGGGRWGGEEPVEKRLTAEEVAQRGRVVQRWMGRRYLKDFTLEGAPRRALDAIVRLASDCGSELILLRIPGIVPNDTARLRQIDLDFLSFMQAFTDRTGLPFHDVLRDEVGLGADHYADFSHLNREGAELFSAYLAREILLPAMGSTEPP